MGAETVLAVEFRTIVVTLKRSLISHPRVETAVFATSRLRKRDVVKYYYGPFGPP